ncbi:peroxisomal ATPase PEX6 [Polymixia lowei]
MAAQVELTCLETFPTHLNPLHVLVSRSHLDLLHVLVSRSTFRYVYDNIDTASALLFTPKRLQHRRRSGILLCAHIMPEEDLNPEDLNKTIKVFTSRFFLRHHSLNHSAGTIRLITPSVLTTVVIGAQTRQTFRWATSEKFSSGLLVLASSQDQNLLARQGDLLPLPYHPLLGDEVRQNLLDLLVLDCRPVTQGRITAETCLIVTDCWDLRPSSSSSSSSSPSRPPTQLFVSDFAHFSSGLGGGKSLLDNRKLLGSGFSGFLEALESRVEVRVVDMCYLIRQAGVWVQDEHLDWDSSIFVSKQLLLKLGLFNHEWVLLSRLSCSTEKPSSWSRPPSHQTLGPLEGQTVRGGRKTHLVSVIVVDLSGSLELQDSVGLISTTHWFNLTEGEQLPVGSRTLRIKRWNQPSPPPDVQLSESFCRLASPQFANELHLQPIISPEYSPQACCDTLLSEHFSIPRLVRQGDVLTIPSEHHPDLLDHSDGTHRWPVVYFRVKKVCVSAEREDKRGAYLADRLHTSLYMGASTTSRAPCCCVGEGTSLWASLAPPGLSNTVDQVITIILPHLNRSCGDVRGCSILLQGPRGSGKVSSVRAVCRRLHLHLLKVDCVSVCAETAAACEVKMRAAFQRAGALGPCVLLLRNLQLVGQPREGTEEDTRVQAALCHLLTNTPTSVAVIATTSRPRELSVDVMAAFVHQVSLESPSEEQRRVMLGCLSLELPLGTDVNLDLLAKHTAGLVLGDLRVLLVEAGRVTHTRLLRDCVCGPGAQQEEELCVSGVSILNQDITLALENLQEAQAHAIGAPKIPSVRWQDVGGLQEVKREILNTVQLPLEHPELLSLGLRRAGLLLYGPPGTGKTLLAKAVATECSMTFLSVKGPELINMYVGQSEENVREVFSRARAAAPCVIFFDELDSLAPSRGRSGDSGGVMDRVVSQLVSELDGLHSCGGLFVIGATNRPDLLDQALLRPGRFDKLVYVGINTDRRSQLQVLKAIVRKFQVDPGVCLEEVVERCPPQLSGADLYALCSEAMMSAVKRKITLITEGVDTEASPLLLSAEDFNRALENLKPSVTDQELFKYQHIQQKLTAK